MLGLAYDQLHIEGRPYRKIMLRRRTHPLHDDTKGAKQARDKEQATYSAR